jgi:hypothetical protein
MDGFFSPSIQDLPVIKIRLRVVFTKASNGTVSLPVHLPFQNPT